ncbi:MAG: hypothetical protein FWC27_12585 [Firmicutes bacterium]|nr:hypothetical protein [Bacillota bacterium]
MSAKENRAAYGLPEKGKSIRDYLTGAQCRIIDMLQQLDMGMLVAGGIFAFIALANFHLIVIIQIVIR